MSSAYATDVNNYNMMIDNNVMSATQQLICDNVCDCGDNINENNLWVFIIHLRTSWYVMQQTYSLMTLVMEQVQRGMNDHVF